MYSWCLLLLEEKCPRVLKLLDFLFVSQLDISLVSGILGEEILSPNADQLLLCRFVVLENCLGHQEINSCAQVQTDIKHHLDHVSRLERRCSELWIAFTLPFTTRERFFPRLVSFLLLFPVNCYDFSST